MSGITFDTVKVGDKISTLRKPRISRTTLALYARASGDQNPIHLDVNFARSAGAPDVLVHGMLLMAYVGKALTDWVPQSSLRSFNVRFIAIAHVNDAITCTGHVTGKEHLDGEKRVRLELVAVNQDGEEKVRGEAIVALL